MFFSAYFKEQEHVFAGRVKIVVTHPAGQAQYFCPLILIIRIYHECEGGIEKSVSRITVLHLEAYTNNGLFHFSCSPLNTALSYLK